jgi:SsrA-binding protein
MAEKTQKKTPPTIQNRKASFDYQIEDTYEVGIALQGTEVKSIRAGHVSFTDSFAYLDNGELFLKDLYIKEFAFGSYNNHEATRVRKLLLKKKEIEEIDILLHQKGYTVVPLKIYFKNGFAKVLIGLAKGKKKYDKRDSIAERDSQRELKRDFKTSQF